MHSSLSENMLFAGSQTSEVKALAPTAHLSPPFLPIFRAEIKYLGHNSNSLNLKIKLSFLNKLHIMHFF